MERFLKSRHHGINTLLPQPVPRPACRFPIYRRHLHALNPAGDDAIEVRQISGDVEGKPVPGNPLLHVNADARDFLAAGPHARESRVALREDAEHVERLDQRLLERTQIPMQVLLVGAEIENRITDELAGPVERDVSAALHFEHVDPGRLEHVPGLRIPAQRDDRRVLEQQQHVVGQAAGNAIFSELALPVQRLGVGHSPGLNHPYLVHAVPVPLSSSPFPRTAHRVARMPNATFSRSQTISPRGPKKRSSTAARKPTRHAPTAANTAMTPRCQTFSSAWLRYQATTPPTPTAATMPTTSGLPAV